MIVRTVTETKKEMSSLLDDIEDNRTPVLITRGSRPPAIMMSYEDYQGFAETAYLRASPANTRRLDQAVADYRAGKAVQKPLAKDE